MTVFNMHRAKTNLSDLVARAEAGEEIVIARRNRPVAKLIPLTAADTSAAALPAQPDSGPDPFEHAPEDYISKQDIAAYYRKYPNDWLEMRTMVGFAEGKQAEYDVDGLAAAMREGREFPLLRGGKVVATIVPSIKEPRKPGRFAHLSGSLPKDLFDQPLSDDELQAWEGKHSFDGSK